MPPAGLSGWCPLSLRFGRLGMAHECHGGAPDLLDDMAYWNGLDMCRLQGRLDLEIPTYADVLVGKCRSVGRD